MNRQSADDKDPDPKRRCIRFAEVGIHEWWQDERNSYPNTSYRMCVPRVNRYACLHDSDPAEERGGSYAGLNYVEIGKVSLQKDV